MRQVLIINQKIEEAEEIAHNLRETKAEITCVSSIHEALCQFIQKELSLVILDSNISIALFLYFFLFQSHINCNTTDNVLISYDTYYLRNSKRDLAYNIFNLRKKKREGRRIPTMLYSRRYIN